MPVLDAHGHLGVVVGGHVWEVAAGLVAHEADPGTDALGDHLDLERLLLVVEVEGSDVLEGRALFHGRLDVRLVIGPLNLHQRVRAGKELELRLHLRVAGKGNW